MAYCLIGFIIGTFSLVLLISIPLILSVGEKDDFLYIYYKNQYIKYRKKVLSKEEEKFEEYKENNRVFMCGLNDECCYGKECVPDFEKEGCEFLKMWKENK